MGNELTLKVQIKAAYDIVRSLEMEPDYKVQAFAIVLSYFLATP